MAFKARLAPSPVHRYLPIRFKREERAPKLRQARAAVSDARDAMKSKEGGRWPDFITVLINLCDMP
jgi:hypothetical protein